MNLFKTTALTLSLLVASLLASGNIAAAQSTPAHNHDHEQAEQSTSLPTAELEGTYAETEGDHVLGSPTAPITMIIYASVTCPHCASWFNSIWPDIKNSYVDSNKVRVVLREFPTNPSDIAVFGFQLANCAPEDEYFGMIEHLMTEQDNIFTSLNAGTGVATFLEIAKKAGLETEDAMFACNSDQSGIDRINKSIALANSADIHSVPSFIINGKVLEQSSEYLPLSKHLNKLLAQGYSPMLQP